MQRHQDWLRQAEKVLEALSDRPDADRFQRSLARLLAERGGDLEFVVLFGSMARGNWSRGSDYDLLIGLRAPDGQRLIDRIGDFDALVEGNVQVFPYDRPDWERMFADRHTLLLEAFEHGLVLHDRGGFGTMRREFAHWRATGAVTPLPSGWRIAPEREEPATGSATSMSGGEPPRRPLSHPCSAPPRA